MEAQSSLGCYKSFVRWEVFYFNHDFIISSSRKWFEFDENRKENHISHGLLWQTATWCDWSLWKVVFFFELLTSLLELTLNLKFSLVVQIFIEIFILNLISQLQPGKTTWWNNPGQIFKYGGLSPRDGPREGQVHCLFFSNLIYFKSMRQLVSVHAGEFKKSKNVW